MEIAVYKDCWHLLETFESAANADPNGATYTLFHYYWRDLQMKFIYGAQTMSAEIMQTTLAALHVAKRVACGRRTHGEEFTAKRGHRIGAIYLMYAIYHRQPTRHFIKIEVSPATWDALASYMMQLHRGSFDRSDTQQVCYIFRDMVKSQAFRYTAVDYQCGLEDFVVYDSEEEIKNGRKAKMGVNIPQTRTRLDIDDLNELPDLISSMKPLCQLEEVYNKQVMPFRSRSGGCRIFSQLQDTFKDISKLISAQDTIKDISVLNDAQDEQPTTSHSAAKNSLLMMRQSLRKKAKIVGEENAQAQQSSSSQSVTAPRPVSQRGRPTVGRALSHPLPDDIIKELTL